MAEADIEQVKEQPSELMLDPFGFHVGVTSRIEGLGGSTPGHDHTYVFHTPYVEAAEGRAHFHIRVHGLKANRGTLVLRVNMLPLEEGAHARMVNSERITLNRLAGKDQLVAIAFEGFRGVAFALHGSIPDDTDAAADALVVTLDRPADPNEHTDVTVDLTTTAFGRDSVKPTPRLITIDPPRLSAPVSQMGTAAQLAERTAADWIARAGVAKAAESERWQVAYILQVLRRYGLLDAGAHGLALAAEGSAVPAVIAATGTKVVATYLPPDAEDGVESPDGDVHVAARAALRRRHLDEAAFEQLVTVRPVILRPLSKDLINFDFLWSEHACEQLGSVSATIAFVQDSMGCLRPGGLAVHMLPFDVLTAQPRMEERQASLFQRRHLERVALTLISRGHEVAQLNVAGKHVLVDRPGAQPGLRVAAFGIVARRARVND